MIGYYNQYTRNPSRNGLQNIDPIVKGKKDRIRWFWNFPEEIQGDISTLAINCDTQTFRKIAPKLEEWLKEGSKKELFILDGMNAIRDTFQMPATYMGFLGEELENYKRLKGELEKCQ